MTRNIGIAAAVLAVVALAGCSQEAPGSPTPVETTGTTGTSTPTSATNSDALSKLQPCDLLDTSLASQLSVRDAKDVSTSGTRACRWRAEGTANFSINILGGKGIADIVLGKGTVSEVKIGNHSGKREEGFDGTGSCRVSLGVSESSRVDFRSVAGADTAKACKIAMDGATAVEPKLP